MKNERTLRQDMGIIRRGIREFGNILPGQMGHVLVRSILVAGIPFLETAVSAYLLNELTGSRDREKLFLLCILGTGLILALSLWRNYEDCRIETGYQRLFAAHEISLTGKACALPYELLEQDSTRSLRDEVSGSISLSGAGMASLYWDMDVLWTNLCTVGMGAVILCCSLTGMLSAGKAAGGDRTAAATLAAALGLGALVALCSLVACRMTGKRFDATFGLFLEGARYARYGDYYHMTYLPDEDAAMDARIYRQEKLVLNQCQSKCYERLAEGKERDYSAASRYDGIKLCCSLACGCAVYLAIGRGAMEGTVGCGSVILLYSAVTQVTLAAARMAEILTDLRNNNEHLLRYFRYMDLPQAQEEPEDFGTTGGLCAGERRKRTAKSRCLAKSLETSDAMENPGAGKFWEEPDDMKYLRTEGKSERGKKPKPQEYLSVGESSEALQDAHIVQTVGKGSISGNAGNYEIIFQNVTFRYPGSAAYALKNVSLHLGAREKAVIVGENGSGKTTLIKLLCRLYRPQEGSILLNGRDIWDYPYEEYMGYLAAVFQDFSLFAFSLAENVAGSRSYDVERVHEAIEKVGLADLVAGYAKGIAQPLFHDFDEEGVDISGGEAQKLAIARAIYKDAPLMVLDEPTAALDPYAEYEVYKNFGKLAAGRTVLFVSHRLSSCRMCDRIIVMDAGQAVQSGTHEELLAERDGKYSRLWNAQARYYTDV